MLDDQCLSISQPNVFQNLLHYLHSLLRSRLILDRPANSQMVDGLLRALGHRGRILHFLRDCHRPSGDFERILGPNSAQPILILLFFFLPCRTGEILDESTE
ncbi:hypothetical protein GGP84_002885 [Salinibacter ruber]|nr:hypothetical protein [Salinibacter ruber]MCS3940233.1 hypothetical protein [Salinibacter ruber]